MEFTEEELIPALQRESFRPDIRTVRRRCFRERGFQKTLLSRQVVYSETAGEGRVADSHGYLSGPELQPNPRTKTLGFFTFSKHFLQEKGPPRRAELTFDLKFITFTGISESISLHLHGWTLKERFKGPGSDCLNHLKLSDGFFYVRWLIPLTEGS